MIQVTVGTNLSKYSRLFSLVVRQSDVTKCEIGLLSVHTLMAAKTEFKCTDFSTCQIRNTVRW